MIEIGGTKYVPQSLSVQIISAKIAKELTTLSM